LCLRVKRTMSVLEKIPGAFCWWQPPSYLLPSMTCVMRCIAHRLTKIWAFRKHLQRIRPDERNVWYVNSVSINLHFIPEIRVSAALASIKVAARLVWYGCYVQCFPDDETLTWICPSSLTERFAEFTLPFRRNFVKAISAEISCGPTTLNSLDEYGFSSMCCRDSTHEQ
jgi:hypothetical protein